MKAIPFFMCLLVSAVSSAACVDQVKDLRKEASSEKYPIALRRQANDALAKATDKRTDLNPISEGECLKAVQQAQAILHGQQAQAMHATQSVK